MIEDLKLFANKVAELPDYAYTSWNSYDEITKFPAFILDEVEEKFEPVVHNGQVYDYTLNAEFYIFAQANSNLIDFDNLLLNTIKKIFAVSEFQRIRLTSGKPQYLQMAAHKLLAYSGEIEAIKKSVSYEP